MDCKLCHKVQEMSTADPKMCKKCYTDLTQYRRWISKKKKPELHQVSRMARINSYIEHNILIGGYVPQFYSAQAEVKKCGSCDSDFVSPVDTRVCTECRVMESNYITAIKNDTQTDKYEAIYHERFRAGKIVPKAYLLKYGLA